MQPAPTTNRSTMQRQTLLVVTFVVLSLLFMYAVRGILLPFVVGMIVAYIMSPSVDWLARHRLERGIAALMVLLLFFGFVVMIILLLMPMVQDQVLTFIGRLPDYLRRLKIVIEPWREYITNEFFSKGNTGHFEELVSTKGEDILRWAAGLLSQVVSSGFALANLLSLILISPIVAFYLLRDFNKFTARVRTLIPPQYRPDVQEQAAEVNRTLAGFLRGQAMVCVVLGSYFATMLTVIGLDFGLMIGLFAGMLAFLPYVGSSLGLLLCLGLGYVQFHGDLQPLLTIAIAYGAGQLMEGNFLTPYLVGGRVGLHPVWIIFALLAGGALFGFLGVLIAVPVAAVIGVLIRYAINNYVKSDFYHAGASPKTAPKTVRAKARRKS
jgi:predicted PurR-regulated permease PerM